MSLRLQRHATRDLARIGLVLSPRHARRSLVVGSALLVGALSAGAGSGYLYGAGEPRAAAAVRFAMSAATPDATPDGIPKSVATSAASSPAAAEDPLALQQLQRRLDQSRLTLDLAESRGRELERQIDALNQRLRETQEELAFFRRAGARKH